jgi:hypothetical protein
VKSLAQEIQAFQERFPDKEPITGTDEELTTGFDWAEELIRKVDDADSGPICAVRDRIGQARRAFDRPVDLPENVFNLF